MAGKTIGKVSVKVYPDTKGFKGDLKRDLQRIKREVGDLDIKVVPEMNKAAANRTKAQMEKLRQSLSGKNVLIDPQVSRAGRAKASTILGVLTRDRHVNIRVGLNEATVAKALAGLMALGGARVALDSLHAGIDQLMTLDQLVPKIGMVSYAIVGLSAYALSATGNLLSLVNSIAAIAPAALTLPGIFGGMAVGLGATVAALKDFNKYVPQARGYMADLQNTISGNFWSVASDNINAFIDSVFPVLLSNLARTGTALGTFFSNLSASFTSILNPGLEAMFDSLNASILKASEHTDSFASIIRILGEVGSGYLERLAGWFGKLSDQFANWLQLNASNGNLTFWIDQAIVNLMALGDVIKETGRIFGGLGKAAMAAGGTTLTSLAQSLKGVADVIASPGFQKGMTEVFASAFKAVSNFNTAALPGLKAGLLSIGDLFSDLAPKVGANLGHLVGEIGKALANPQVRDGITSMFDGFDAAMQNLLPAIGPVATMLAALGPVVGALATQISGLLTDSIDRMVPTFLGITDAAVPLINLLGGLFSSVLTTLTPLFQVMGQNITRVMLALAPLIEQVQALWNILGPVLVPVLMLVANIIGDAVVGAINGVTNVLKGAVEIIQGVIDFVVAVVHGDWKGAWEAAKKIFSGIWTAIKGIIQVVWNVGILGLLRKGWTVIKTVSRSAGANLKTLVSTLWESIKTRTKTLWGQIQVMPQAAMSAIWKFIKGIAGDLKAAASLAWEGIKSSAVQKLEALYKIFTKLPGKIKGFLAGAGTLLTGIGKDIINGLISGIESKFKVVKSKLKSLTDLLPSWKGPREKDKKLLTPAGRMIIDGLIRGLESQYDSVFASLRNLTSDIGREVAGQKYQVGIETQAEMAGGIQSLTGSLTRTVSVAAEREPLRGSKDAVAPISIGNITIPLEDLEQLRSLEDFLDMLRVRSRKGIAPAV